MPLTQLEQHWKRIIEHGPSRVMREDGSAVRPHLASFEPTVIFIREDGWSLGANEKTESVARAQWPDTWIGVMRLVNHDWTLEDYK